MTWRMAYSLDVLLGQLNAMYPHRSKESDGGIGDAEHATRDSDHNPWYGPGIVTARDFTHDPDNGIDCRNLANWLTTSGDARVKYVIWNRRIWTRVTGWAPYNGVNPHTKHLHLSVVAAPGCDMRTPWKLGKDPLAMTLSAADVQTILNHKVGADWPSAFDAWKDNPGTVGHFLNGLGEHVKATRDMVTDIKKTVDGLQ